MKAALWAIGFLSAGALFAFLMWFERTSPTAAVRTFRAAEDAVANDEHISPLQRRPSDLARESARSDQPRVVAAAMASARSPSNPETSGDRPRKSFADLVQEVTRTETRDTRWATQVEGHFKRKAEASGYKVTIRQVDCASVRCTVKLQTPSRDVFALVPGWFGDGVVTFEGTRTADGYDYQAVYARNGFGFDGRPHEGRRQ